MLLLGLFSEILNVGPIFASNKAWFACNKQTLTLNGNSDYGYFLGLINVNYQCFQVLNVCFEKSFPLIIFLSCPVPNKPLQV